MFEQWADFVSKIWPLCSMWEPIFVHKSDFFTLHPYNPIFLWAQTDSTQWDHNFPITGGNFGYLWFSGRYSFGCLAGCFRALIAQKSPFLGQKCCFFWTEVNFSKTSKWQYFCGDRVAGWAPVGRQGLFLVQKEVKIWFFNVTPHLWPILATLDLSKTP